MKMKELCRRTGLTERAVRLYEQKGLVAPGAEGKGGREYGREEQRRLMQIGLLRKFQFSLEEIGQMLRMPEQIGQLCRLHLQQLEQTSAETQRAAAVLKAVQPEQYRDMGQLADALGAVAAEQKLPLPGRGPDFSRLEEGEPEEKNLPAGFWQGQERRDRVRRMLLIGIAVLVLAGLAVFFGLMGSSRWRVIRSMGIQPRDCWVWKEYQDLNGEDCQIVLASWEGNTSLLCLSRNSLGFWDGYCSPAAGPGELANLTVVTGTRLQSYTEPGAEEPNDPELGFVYTQYLAGQGAGKKVVFSKPLPGGVFGSINQGQDSFQAEFIYTDSSFTEKAAGYLDYGG